jgi:hypothetical protein
MHFAKIDVFSNHNIAEFQMDALPDAIKVSNTDPGIDL